MRTKGLMLVLAAVMLGSTVADGSVRGMGRFSGTITDESGAPIEGVKVVAKQTETGGVVEGTASNDKGDWSVAGIGKGTWMVEFVKPGFAARNAKVILERELDKVPAIKLALRKG